MRIRILSDLHNEFGFFQTNFSENDINVLAGDIRYTNNRLDEIPNLVYIAGNHEFYRRHIHSPIYKALDREVEEFDGIKFFCTTLWTDLSECNVDEEIRIRFYMNDFRLIDGMTWDLWQRMFERNFSWLADQDLEGHVVVTHHAPSFKSVPERYRFGAHSLFNKAYASNLDSLILEKKPALWIHGHTHDSFDYMLGDTRIICNPRGYANHEENPDFVEKLIYFHGE